MKEIYSLLVANSNIDLLKDLVSDICDAIELIFKSFYFKNLININ